MKHEPRCYETDKPVAEWCERCAHMWWAALWLHVTKEENK